MDLDLDRRICSRRRRRRLEIWEFPFWIGLRKQGFRLAWDITGQKSQGVGLKLKAVILFFQGLPCYLCQEWLVGEIWSVTVVPGSGIFQNHCFAGI